jgi:hypothetical protein
MHVGDVFPAKQGIRLQKRHWSLKVSERIERRGLLDLTTEFTEIFHGGHGVFFTQNPKLFLCDLRASSAPSALKPQTPNPKTQNPTPTTYSPLRGSK